ncbi:MAG: YceI family protein [Caldilineaceae bacterium]|nr:YceI family protein [Caldilineaceae bacterium]
MTQVVFRMQIRLIVVLLCLVAALVACQNGGTQPTAEPSAPTTVATTAAAEPAAAATDTPVSTAEDETEPATAEANDTQTAVPSSGAKTFQLSQAGTEARFYIDEVLMGQDKTVIGVTSLVEGEITVDPADPSSAHIGTIRIDASDLKTDSDRRNGAIQRFVLQSSQAAYQYITFTPTALEGLPATVTLGEPFQFTVTGDLTIRDITLSQSFPLTVTANTENELVGSGATTISLADYQLTIPSVPSVAWVAEEVKLELAFTATAQ